MGDGCNEVMRLCHKAEDTNQVVSESLQALRAIFCKTQFSSWAQFREDLKLIFIWTVVFLDILAFKVKAIY